MHEFSCVDRRVLFRQIREKLSSASEFFPITEIRSTLVKQPALAIRSCQGECHAQAQALSARRGVGVVVTQQCACAILTRCRHFPDKPHRRAPARPDVSRWEGKLNFLCTLYNTFRCTNPEGTFYRRLALPFHDAGRTTGKSLRFHFSVPSPPLSRDHPSTHLGTRYRAPRAEYLYLVPYEISSHY